MITMCIHSLQKSTCPFCNDRKMKEWTLFLDRDGVINQRAEEGKYVTSIEEFIFLPNALKAIFILSRIFGRIIILTNQQGIAKNMLDLDELSLIHSHLTHEVETFGGRIDGIFFCPHAEGKCDCRKPKIGLVLEACRSFLDIQPAKSFVVGDSDTDMQLADEIGAQKVFIGKGGFESLFDFSVSLRNKRQLGEVLGVIAGAFDVIHPGYIKMFAEAKENCSRLLVLLHIDPSIENPLKPKPVLSVEERREILLAIKYVDEVREYQTEDELYKIIEELPSHIRILGCDYQDRECTGNSPMVHYCNRDHGWSATKFKRMIIERGLPI